MTEQIGAPAFTPGPWHAGQLDRPDMLVHIHGARNEWVGSVLSRDARLIAAAPQIYDALVELVAVYEGIGLTRKRHAARARAALAAATGVYESD